MIKLSDLNISWEGLEWNFRVLGSFHEILVWDHVETFLWATLTILENPVPLEQVVKNHEDETWNPSELLHYNNIDLDGSLWLEKYWNINLEIWNTHFLSLSIIWESHEIILFEKSTEKAIFSEIVACLPINWLTPTYKLNWKKWKYIEEKWYKHKIVNFSLKEIKKLFNIEFENGEDELSHIQNYIITEFSPNIYYNFPIKDEKNWLDTFWTTAIKVYYSEEERIIYVYTIHWYIWKKPWITWSAPDTDRIIFTVSEIDLDWIQNK